MPEPSLLDPLFFWRDLVTQLEKGVNDLSREGMKSPELRRIAGQVSDANTVRKKMTQAVLKRYFEALDLPSRSDVQALDERLQIIEDRVIGIASTLDRLAGSAAGGTRPTVAGPARTRRPPPTLDAAPASAPTTAVSAPVRRKKAKRRPA